MVRNFSKTRSTRKGIAIIVAMIFLAIFGAFAVAMASMSTTNVEAASNQTKAGRALMSAQSGCEMMRYVLRQVKISGKVPDSDIVSRIGTEIGEAANGMPVTFTTTSMAIASSSVTLNAAAGQSFTSRISRPDTSHLVVETTGRAGAITRKVRETYNIITQGHSAFDFGVATKGPLNLQGNISVEGVTVASDADVYIESLNTNAALEMIGKCSIQGDVKIVNPTAIPSLSSQASIGGEKGAAAIADHVDIGVPATDFPVPVATDFEAYATGPVMTTTNPVGSTLTNVVIAPNTNPKFTGNVTINGILYIKQPNVVDFGGNVNVTGLIVCEGDVDFPLTGNKVIFRGGITSLGVDQLPQEEQYVELRKETGTFLMAPGFNVSMGGNFGTLNGAIAANGVEFFGNAGGTIKGSVINYSENAMTLSGNSDLYFNRSGVTSIPAGFIPERILAYDASTYEEPVL
jgi:hypothetical protein